MNLLSETLLFPEQKAVPYFSRKSRCKLSGLERLVGKGRDSHPNRISPAHQTSDSKKDFAGRCFGNKRIRTHDSCCRCYFGRIDSTVKDNLRGWSKLANRVGRL